MLKKFETDQVMNNLEEAIITKDFKTIGYCNNRGTKVIEDIHEMIKNNEKTQGNIPNDVDKNQIVQK